MKISVISLFPEVFAAVSKYGVSSRAIKKEIVKLECVNLRDYSLEAHAKVDDRPFGGGPGMVLQIQPLESAVLAVKSRLSVSNIPIIYLSPQGQKLTQKLVNELSLQANLILIAGRYEGVDERFIQKYVTEEISIGDYVLSGGELAACVLIDAIIRQLPGSLGHNMSAVEDSFSNGLLDYPHYTRPKAYAGNTVPEVLLNGNHEQIRRFRLKQSLIRTYQRRADLLECRSLSGEEQELLDEYLAKHVKNDGK